MVNESVQQPKERTLADDRVWTEEEWQDGKFPVRIPAAVRNRLAKIDTAVYACFNLNQLLLDDRSAGQAAEREADDSPHKTLHRELQCDQVSAIHIAMRNLLSGAMDAGDHVRNNINGCWEDRA